MFQHGASGLRATTAESVIELVDAQGVRALVARDGHATCFIEAAEGLQVIQLALRRAIASGQSRT
jgi:hypothetical protein